jgi:hypothetical protein
VAVATTIAGIAPMDFGILRIVAPSACRWNPAHRIAVRHGVLKD